MQYLVWLLQNLMNFVLSKAGSRLMQAEADPRASMSAARAIVEVCNVAQSHDMPMPSSVLDGLVQLIQQTTDPNVRHTTCSSAVTENKQKIVLSCLKQHMTQNIMFVNMSILCYLNKRTTHHTLTRFYLTQPLKTELPALQFICELHCMEWQGQSTGIELTW